MYFILYIKENSLINCSELNLQKPYIDFAPEVSNFSFIKDNYVPGLRVGKSGLEKSLEKELIGKGITKKQLGRDKFIKEVWKWKKESGDQILNQLKKLGCSCDWSRNRFTMDKDLSEAVTKTFVQLYKKKIIYKDTKLVNWDTKLETAISDLEVEQKEVQSNLYYIKYKIVGKDSFLTIATTRPETMLGDTAVAVNPCLLYTSDAADD